MIFSVIVLTSIIVKAVDKKNTPTQSDSPCPKEMAYIPSPYGGFCIDKYEASAGKDCPYANPENQRQTLLNIDSPECSPVSVAGAYPWRNISQNQAAEICAKAGKRLPTNKEWQQAALGTPDNNKNWTTDDCQVNNNWPEQPGITGSGKNCHTAAGVYDMIGNVWEWVDGNVNNGNYHGYELPNEGYVLAVNEDGMPSETNANNGDENYHYDFFWLKTKGTRGIARGGYWNNKKEAGQYSVYVVSQPSFTGVGVGFRCAK